MEKTEQPLSKPQRKELESIVAISTQLVRGVLFFGFILLLGFLFRFLQHLFVSFPPFWLVPTVAIGIWLYIRSARWTGGRELRRLAREDLEKGVATITVIQPVSVIEVEEIEDEGSSYLIETSTNESFLLTGQEMERYKRKKFPWEKIGIIEAPRSKLFFGLKRMGEPRPIDSTLRPFTYEEAKGLGCFETNFIILDEAKKRILDEME